MRVQVVSPWYPDSASPYSGIFVQKQVAALRTAGHEVVVEVPQIFPAPMGSIPVEVRTAVEKLGISHPDRMYHTVGGVTYVPAPVPSKSGFIGRARAFAANLDIKRKVLPNDADITHAHLGVPTGWAALRLGDTPLVVTEHQSTLREVFAEPEAADAYRETIENASAFICVSTHLKSQIVEGLGEWTAERIEVIPNIVDLTNIPFVIDRDRDFKSWVYVGGLAPHKGVEKLLRVFVAYRHTVEPLATLTLVGDGVLRKWVDKYASSHDAARAVTLTGAVDHAKVGRYLAEADLMVHLSPRETFGIASLEAIAAGLPVVSAKNGGADSAWGSFESDCGLLVDPDTSADELVRLIVSLREQTDRLRPDHGRAMGQDRFSPDVVARSIMNVYERCLAHT
jgi:glycosyltransferase involved in cell wall biosynthesis